MECRDHGTQQWTQNDDISGCKQRTAMTASAANRCAAGLYGFPTPSPLLSDSYMDHTIAKCSRSPYLFCCATIRGEWRCTHNIDNNRMIYLLFSYTNRRRSLREISRLSLLGEKKQCFTRWRWRIKNARSLYRSRGSVTGRLGPELSEKRS